MKILKTNLKESKLYENVILNTSGLIIKNNIVEGVEADIVLPDLLRIPIGVTEIARHAFYNRSDLQEVVIPFTATKVGEEAFADSSLRKITLGKNIIEIESGAFEGCTNLTNIVLPEKLIEVSNSCFAECPNLTSVIFNNNIKKINDYAFNAARSLNQLTAFPEQLETIGEYAFAGCNSLSTISFSPNLIQIKEYAFAYCQNLKKVAFPQKIDVIGTCAFTECPNLSDISFDPQSSVTLGTYAFSECPKLEFVKLPDDTGFEGEDPFDDHVELEVKRNSFVSEIIHEIHPNYWVV